MTQIDRRDALLLTLLPALAAAGLPAAPAMAQQNGAGSPAQIQAAMHGLQGVRIPRSISVVGAGGSGCWPALFAALCGVEEMLLTDAADVSADDLGRTLYRPSDIGRPKSEALADLLSQFRPGLRVTARKRFVEPGDADIYVGTVLFDGVNYPPLNAAMRNGAQQRGMTYVVGFYNGLSAGVADGVPEGYAWAKSAETPVWAPSAALCGILQVYSAFASPLALFGQPADVAMDPAQISATLSEQAGRLAK
jgi:hypothetical protein